jgi:hypothetical protein
MLGNPDLQEEAHSERVGLELFRPREKTVPVRISEASIHRNSSRESNSSRITILLYNLLGPATLVIHCPLSYFTRFDTFRSLFDQELSKDIRHLQHT